MKTTKGITRKNILTNRKGNRIDKSIFFDSEIGEKLKELTHITRGFCMKHSSDAVAMFDLSPLLSLLEK